MQNKNLNKIIIIILLAMAIGYIINAFMARNALKDIKNDIHKTHEDLMNVHKQLGLVANSLEKSTETINTIIGNLEKSKAILDSLTKKTGSLSGGLRKEIEKTTVYIDSVLNNMKGEAAKNKKLIENLDNTIVR